MKNKQLKLIVKEAIHTYMTANMAFTSVDICNYLRSENLGENIRMDRVSKYIRKQALGVSTDNTFMYNVSFIKIDSEQGIRAYLYHHMDFDINNYMARDQTTLKTLK